jgi:hypothetical protein
MPSKLIRDLKYPYQVTFSAFLRSLAHFLPTARPWNEILEQIMNLSYGAKPFQWKG